MCGIAGIIGPGLDRRQLAAMIAVQRHRGPDAADLHLDTGEAGLGHARLSIIDLSEAGRQPFADRMGTRQLVFNGEIYNHVELRRELDGYPWRSRTDTEVILAAYERWGEACLDRLVGMFAFAIWDARARRLFAARDRFGVKPFYYHVRDGHTLLFASEIKALHAAGVAAGEDESAWAAYLAHGLTEHAPQTLWRGIHALPPGHALTWQEGRLQQRCWYDLADRTGCELDTRPDAVVIDEYRALLEDAVRLRFRADVPVGIALSGGLDSSVLLGIVQLASRDAASVAAFSYCTGDPDYDEVPWIEQMVAQTRHPSVLCRLTPGDVPDLAMSLQQVADEPVGGLPTLAYARLFEESRRRGTLVILDGQGMDEQWAGYDYYAGAATAAAPLVQGSRDPATRPDVLLPEFRARARPFAPPQPFPDALRNLQYRDARYTKIPRALRFNDRASMRASVELREPFLDHRLFELALRQPARRKIQGSTGKWLLRQLAARWLPLRVVEAPKRPVSTPQREWLRGPLRTWAGDCIDQALASYGGTWFDAHRARETWRRYCAGDGDNSLFVWQWISLGLMAAGRLRTPQPAATT